MESASVWFSSGNIMKGEDRKHLCFVAMAGLASWTVESAASRAAATTTRETRRPRKSILTWNEVRPQRLRKHDYFRPFSFEGSLISHILSATSSRWCAIWTADFAKRLSRRSRFENRIRRLPETCTADERSWRIRSRRKRCCPPYKVCLWAWPPPPVPPLSSLLALFLRIRPRRQKGVFEVLLMEQ